MATNTDKRTTSILTLRSAPPFLELVQLQRNPQELSNAAKKERIWRCVLYTMYIVYVLAVHGAWACMTLFKFLMCNIYNFSFFLCIVRVWVNNILYFIFYISAYMYAIMQLYIHMLIYLIYICKTHQTCICELSSCILTGCTRWATGVWHTGRRPPIYDLPLETAHDIRPVVGHVVTVTPAAAWPVTFVKVSSRQVTTAAIVPGG